MSARPAEGRLGDAAVALAAELVAVDSVNPGLVPDAAGEALFVEMLRRRLDRRGFRTEVVLALGGADRPSLLASAGAGDGPRLVLNGHLDTVGVGGMADPTPRLEGDLRTGRLYGRGACDMKGGVAGLVVAAEEVASTGLAGEVVLALVADEEDASVGTEAVLAHLLATGRRPDACLVGEPTWLDLVVAHRGFAVLEVVLRGVALHTSRPETGVDSIAHLGRLLGAVARHDVALAARPPHPLVGTGSLLASVVSGGEAPFTLAGSARAVLERRTLPGESADEALAEVHDLLVELGREDPLFDPELTLLLAREPWEAGRDGAGLPTSWPEHSWRAVETSRYAGGLRTGWTPRSGVQRGSPRSCAARRARACTRPTSGSTWLSCGPTPSPWRSRFGGSAGCRTAELSPE